MINWYYWFPDTWPILIVDMVVGQNLSIVYRYYITTSEHIISFSCYKYIFFYNNFFEWIKTDGQVSCRHRGWSCRAEQHWCCTRGCGASCIQPTCRRRIELQRRSSWAVGEVACCMLFRPSRRVSGSHPAVRTHTHTHTPIHMHPHHAEVPVHWEDAWLFAAEEENSIWEQLPVAPSDFNLWNVCFARFSHKMNKTKKLFQRSNMFLFFFVFFFWQLSLSVQISICQWYWLCDLYKWHYLWQRVLF